MTVYSIRMRSSQNGHHISGAERLVAATDLEELAARMTNRALTHSKGCADDIVISINAVAPADVCRVPALAPVQTNCQSPDHARELMHQILSECGVQCTDAIVAAMYSVTGLRGAMLIDAKTGQRLEPDLQRGVRASAFDAEINSVSAENKDHFHEALILASKVQSAPHIIAEVCISDDVDYTKGYIATNDTFYRVPNIKDMHSPLGTRAFIYDGPLDEVSATIDYLENTPCLIQLDPNKFEAHR
ncbi:6-carboxyhexanoate--CoA ligase [Corynebacterium sp. H78]|uniref:6-carboxyhexanoate--CoA ligase n=1 Tax=Corynebacterium sp. H78 TaxID=3133417 RepID=UPI0030ABBC97